MQEYLNVRAPALASVLWEHDWTFPVQTRLPTYTQGKGAYTVHSDIECVHTACWTGVCLSELSEQARSL
eukprot:scaffold37004_cov23-Tisochrysis_lutea.AAC.2